MSWFWTFAFKEIRAVIVFLHRDVEDALNALVFSELQVGPLLVVYKLLETFLQVVEHANVRSLYLIVVDNNAGTKFLGVRFVRQDDCQKS